MIAWRREGEGPPVLLLHGVGGDGTHWDAIARALRERASVITMDLRGHGRSERIGAPVTAHDLAQDAVTVLDEAGVACCAVAGFSLGGAVALALALDHPERVSKLAVIGTVCGRTREERSRALDRIELLREQGVAALAEANRSRWFTDAFQAAHPDIVAQRVAQVEACDPASYGYAFAVFCTADFADRLHEIRVPTLVLTGENDVAATPRMAQLMGDRVAGAQVRVLEGLRHSVLIEAPGKVATELARFL